MRGSLWPAVLVGLLMGLGVSGVAGVQRRAENGDVIRGVNIGGWLLTEEWITPGLYDDMADDEWHLCSVLGKKDCLSALQDHWSSFYTRDDFEDIKTAGLNSVRIPIGYWAVDVNDEEPYVSGQYPYLIQAVNWCNELGLTVLVDLHGAPGSQNGQDNSGLIGPVLFPSNSSNEDRSMRVLQNLTIEFSNTIYGGVVIGVELLNEPRISSSVFTMSYLKSFYTRGFATIRAASPSMNVTMHGKYAFYGPEYWVDYNPSNSSASSPASLMTIDTHQYYAFSPLNNLPHDTILESICNISQLLKTTSIGLAPVVVGEWSLETGSAPNASSSAQNKGDTQEKRTWLRLLFEAQLAAYSPNGPYQPSIGWYFWTWKTEYDIDTWSYRKGLDEGYIPADVGNASTLAYPVLPNGCVDSSFNYTAPKNPTRSRAFCTIPVDGLVMLGILEALAVVLTTSLGVL